MPIAHAAADGMPQAHLPSPSELVSCPLNAPGDKSEGNPEREGSWVRGRAHEQALPTAESRSQEGVPRFRVRRGQSPLSGSSSRGRTAEAGGTVLVPEEGRAAGGARVRIV